MEQTAGSKIDLKVNHLHAQLGNIDRLAAPLVLAVALDVHETVKVAVLEIYLNEDSVSQTLDLEGGSGEVGSKFRRRGFRD